MEGQPDNISSNYEQYYARRSDVKVYPTEFVVRTFLSQYPRLSFVKPSSGDKVLDMGFGDGRNTAFLCELGFDVSGVEITQGIVDQTRERLLKLGHSADLRVGRNSRIPFDSDYFDCVLSCHCCYYCDEGESLEDNLSEYSRVIKKGGYLVASVADRSSYIFEGSSELEDGSLLVKGDPYGTRNGYRLYGFSQAGEIESYFAKHFMNFSFGHADNDYYGISERVFWVVCQRRSD